MILLRTHSIKEIKAQEGEKRHLYIDLDKEPGFSSDLVSFRPAILVTLLQQQKSEDR